MVILKSTGCVTLQHRIAVYSCWRVRQRTTPSTIGELTNSDIKIDIFVDNGNAISLGKNEQFNR